MEKNQKAIFRGIAYSGALVLICLVQLLITDRLFPFGVRPMLLPLAAAAGAALEGPFFGAGLGVGAGLLSILALPGASVLYLPLFPAAGLLSGLIGAAGPGGRSLRFFLCALVSLLAVEGLHVIPRLVSGVPLLPLLSVALPELACSLFFSFPVYALFRPLGKRTPKGTSFHF
jgi:hypothetical protein